MQVASTVIKLRYFISCRFTSLNIPAKMIAAIAIAGLTGLLAQVKIPLPFTPVPFTGQVFAMLLAGVLLGSRWGGASMAIYAGLGMIGLPWFSGWTAGLGATAGYIVGFIPAAMFVGHFAGKLVGSRRLLSMVGLMMVATLLYYIPGVFWLAFWLQSAGIASIGLPDLLMMGIAPFILVDVMKAVAAGLVAFTITAGNDYRA
jgi:biotin transport system substrate-specific component